MKNKKFNADEAAKNLGYRSISEMLRLNEIPRSTMYSAIRKNATIEENEDGTGVVVLPPPKPIFEIKKKRKINKKKLCDQSASDTMDSEQNTDENTKDDESKNY